MPRFRKKPVEIEARVWEGYNWDEMVEFVGRGIAKTGATLHIQTLEGTMHARPGDWIIKGVQGEFYPCKPDIFEATYLGPWVTCEDCGNDHLESEQAGHDLWFKTREAQGVPA